MKKLNFLLLCLWSLSGCKSMSSNLMERAAQLHQEQLAYEARFSSLQLGTTEAQVIQTVGDPDSVEMNKKGRWLFYSRLSTPRVLVFKNGRLDAIENNKEELQRRLEIRKAKASQPDQPQVIVLDGRRQARCVDSNIFGKFARGGGCNTFGCWPRGGSCNAFGCSASSECSATHCEDKISSYRCRE